MGSSQPVGSWQQPVGSCSHRSGNGARPCAVSVPTVCMYVCACRFRWEAIRMNSSCITMPSLRPHRLGWYVLIPRSLACPGNTVCCHVMGSWP